MITIDIRITENMELRPCRQYIPNGFATEKSDYIKDKKNVIKQMNIEIKSLEKKIEDARKAGMPVSEQDIKRLKKCREIKQNCEFSITVITMQIEIEKRIRTHKR
ncbi:MAG: hypothetical protein IKF41_03310 [Alphaproteobacteria bacterium]|nr:hypothetical protein [Alphaproteobacteria bacterium]